ncbi:hypothetical protein JCM10914A_45160 [Paenibacillus sp. JCM 10914]|uniref:hypothetical protein n=1 Tax=Paenibacillus sp. JCM 10914 TaxID=1236974 RepID=UPI0003CCB292|nr:hypothetical protein [Paenibacillus sp. JCM 10914]GAE09167.1 hypothetical protein JCM10914_5516 [Paenibacillus sp. JCM 10914]
MKYENASDVIPEGLLKEVQKYAAGKLLYIPSGEEKKQHCHDISGYGHATRGDGGGMGLNHTFH